MANESPSSPPAITISDLSLPTVHDALPGPGDGNGPTLSAGMVSFSIPLSLPVARESAPALTLGYSSSAGNGTCGTGWLLGLPAIQRRTRLGVPQYNDDADDPENKNWIIKDKVFSGDVLAIESRYSMHDKFQTSGKNAYGLTMGLRSAQYSISRMYSPAELPGKD